MDIQLSCNTYMLVMKVKSSVEFMPVQYAVTTFDDVSLFLIKTFITSPLLELFSSAFPFLVSPPIFAKMKSPHAWSVRYTQTKIVKYQSDQKTTLFVGRCCSLFFPHGFKEIICIHQICFLSEKCPGSRSSLINSSLT